MNIKELKEIGIEIREVIRSFIKENEDYGEMVAVRPKDITRKIDMAAEKALDSALLKRGLSARIISEELGDRIIGDSPDFMLVFDPIDGSTNATCGIPFFCTSIAYTDKTDSACFDDITMGVVCDFLGNVYYAVKGNGAFLNDKKIKNTKKDTRNFHNAKKNIYSIYSYGVPNVPDGLIELEKEIILRVFGSIALDMCFVADGSIDCVIDTRNLVNGYDIMASTLILKESGGFLKDLNGNDISGNVNISGLSIIGTKRQEIYETIMKKLLSLNE